MKLTIIGASGHGKVVADIAKLNGYDEVEFLDDNVAVKFCGKYPVVGRSELALTLKNDVFVAIGYSQVRQKMMEYLADKNIPILIHPTAVVAEDVNIGEGTVVMAGTVINSGASIGKGVIVNTSSSIDHDCLIEDFVHVAVGSHLCGTVEVGALTWIGAGVTVSNNIKICSNCMIGAGAVVVENIDIKGTYVGVPAKIIQES